MRPGEWDIPAIGRPEVVFDFERERNRLWSVPMGQQKDLLWSPHPNARMSLKVDYKASESCLHTIFVPTHLLGERTGSPGGMARAIAPVSRPRATSGGSQRCASAQPRALS